MPRVGKLMDRKRNIRRKYLLQFGLDLSLYSTGDGWGYEWRDPNSGKGVTFERAKNSILFLWTTGPQLDVSIDVLRAWGYKYKTVAFVWDKQRVNPGSYTMSQTEFVLVGTRGKIPSPRGARNVKQLLSEARTYHSRKPHEIHRRIEEMFPGQRKLELFARAPYREGWDVGP